jgi:hypothetical protein
VDPNQNHGGKTENNYHFVVRIMDCETFEAFKDVQLTDDNGTYDVSCEIRMLLGIIMSLQ